MPIVYGCCIMGAYANYCTCWLAAAMPALTFCCCWGVHTPFKWIWPLCFPLYWMGNQSSMPPFVHSDEILIVVLPTWVKDTEIS